MYMYLYVYSGYTLYIYLVYTVNTRETLAHHHAAPSHSPITKHVEAAGHEYSSYEPVITSYILSMYRNLLLC